MDYHRTGTGAVSRMMEPIEARSNVYRAQSTDLPKYISTSVLNRMRPEVSTVLCKANMLNLIHM